MQVHPTKLPGVLIVEPKVHGDARGWLMESFNPRTFAAHGLPAEFFQDNHSHSTRGVLRGLHYQLVEPQGKLVRCARGAIRDVAVDVRRGSDHFGKSVAVDLTEENRLMLWVPPGFAHGFAVHSEEADVLYKCTTPWHAASERSLLWNDPVLEIDWGLTDPDLSPKDRAGKPLAEAEVFEYDARLFGECGPPPRG